MKRASIRFTTVLIIGAICSSLIPVGQDSDAYARRKKKKRKMAGEISKLVYTDSEYGFKLTLLDEWDAKVHEADDPLRLVVQKKNCSIPPEFKDAELYTTTPKLKVLIDTTSLELLDFLDSLRSETFDSKQKEALSNELKVLSGKMNRPRVSRLRLESGAKGRLFRTSQNYSINVQKPGETTAKNVQDQIRGVIAFFKKENQLYIVSCVGESQFFDINKPLFDAMIKSFAFTDDE